ncbi:hypothetical protein LCGC14_2782910 [marine sediment metagenome]|uniref:Uncharacterized protein n=1 Tax=marine sediment metagenome TaxID=412755 RepID=A0A0F8YSS4_9ZZZZ
MLKRFPKTWQEEFEDRLISGEYTPTQLSPKVIKELEYKAKYYLKYGKYPKPLKS